jgi:hypothetical protein
MSVLPLVAITMLLVLSLTGCQKKPEVPPPSLPRVERPVLTLDIKPENLLKIRIPRQALVERAGVPGVFVLNQDGRARFRMVRGGRLQASQAEILSGLQGNETLVLGDLTAVHDGSQVTVIRK